MLYMEKCHGIISPLADFCRGQPHLGRAEGDFFLHAAAKELGIGVLPDIADFLVKPFGVGTICQPLLCDRLPHKEVGALVRKGDAVQQPDEGGLAAAVGTSQLQGSTGIYLQAEAMQDGLPRQVAKFDVLQLNDSCASAIHCLA